MLLSLQTGQNNPLLHQRAKKIKKITPEIRQLILDMQETLKKHRGLGLAAPQVGYLIKLIITAEPWSLVLINPKITKTSLETEILEEGCLSLPNICLPIERSKEVIVEALNQKGKKIKLIARNLLARVIQHEIDHLNGILITDRYKPYDKAKK